MGKTQTAGFVSGKGDTPAVVADRLMAEGKYLTDHSDTVYRYNGKYWQELSRTTLRQIALHADGYRKSVEGRRKEIIEQIKARSHLPDLEWGRVADSEVALDNGVVNVLTGELRPHRPDDYLEKVVPWEYRPGATCATWDAALKTWFGSTTSPEALALQEFFGYLLLSHAKYKTALVLFGLSDTGKSVPAHVMLQAVGPRQSCSLPVDQMDDPIARAVIVGKQLNLMTELSVDAMIADGGFKQLVSTEEPVLINQKYKPAFMYVPTAKHVFLTNTLPRMTDRTEAVLNRLLIVPFRRVLAEEEQDERLPDKLIAEMHGIVLWAIDGAKRLIERHGQFAAPGSASSLIQEMRAEANPAIDFIHECLLVDETSAIPLSRLVNDFNNWNKGSKKATAKGLGKMLRAAGQVIKDVRYRKRVMKSLVGFTVISELAPRLLDVPAGAVVSDAVEIQASDMPKADESGDAETL